MRKIGILTYFWASNHGTFLQAYSMQEALNRRFPGDRVELVDLRPRAGRFRPAKRDIYPPYLVDHVRRELDFRRCRRLLQRSPSRLVTQDYDEASAFLAAQGYDLVVVGADTILQPLAGYTARGRAPIYWLPPSLACRKVACAASGGAFAVEDCGEAIRAQMAASIRAFDLVGVRDDATLQLVSALGLAGDPRVELVPDPTFTLPIDPEPAARLLRRAGMDLGRPAILVNLPRLPVFDALIGHYRSQGFQVASLLDRGLADYCLFAAGPFAWTGLSRFFRLTITDRFHGSLFSLRNGTPVVAVNYEHRKRTTAGLSKTYSLMTQFGLAETHHVNIDPGTDVRDLIRTTAAAVETFDADRVRQTDEQMGNRFGAFLDKVAGLLPPGGG